MKLFMKIKYDTEIPIADFTVPQLVSYILHTYKGDPIGALNCLMQNNEVGYVLGIQAKCILEGIVC